MIAFKGVRSSWLTFARKSDLALLAWSASSRAATASAVRWEIVANDLFRSAVILLNILASAPSSSLDVTGTLYSKSPADTRRAPSVN